jgi:hypothetical protein
MRILDPFVKVHGLDVKVTAKGTVLSMFIRTIGPPPPRACNPLKYHSTAVCLVSHSSPPICGLLDSVILLLCHTLSQYFKQLPESILIP